MVGNVIAALLFSFYFDVLILFSNVTGKRERLNVLSKDLVDDFFGGFVLLGFEPTLF